MSGRKEAKPDMQYAMELVHEICARTADKHVAHTKDKLFAPL